MPTLNFDAHTNPVATLRVCMTYPSDDETLREWLSGSMQCDSAAICESDVSRGDSASGWARIAQTDLVKLLNPPNWEDSLKHVPAAQYRGIVAGILLRSVWHMQRGRVEEPGMNKALFLAEAFLVKIKYRHGKSVHASETYLRRCWKSHRWVAHLWAAALGLTRDNPFDDLLWGLKDPKRLLGTLAISEAFRQFGEGFKPTRHNDPEPFLPPQETLKVSLGVPLPEVDLSSCPVPAWVTETAKLYKAGSGY